MDVLDETIHGAAERAQFSAMTDSTAEDWQIIARDFGKHARQGPERILAHLKLLEGDHGGFPVCRLEHSLQTATRAHRDGRNESYVVMALLHDIGDTLGAYNHPDIAAAILKPFVSDELHWICQHHGMFQGYYYYHHLGMDRDQREQFRESPYFEACAWFCEKYDQASFDPEYDSLPLEFFAPMVERVMTKPTSGPLKDLQPD